MEYHIGAAEPSGEQTTSIDITTIESILDAAAGVFSPSESQELLQAADAIIAEYCAEITPDSWNADFIFAAARLFALGIRREIRSSEVYEDFVDYQFTWEHLAQIENQQAYTEEGFNSGLEVFAHAFLDNIYVQDIDMDVAQAAANTPVFLEQVGEALLDPSLPTHEHVLQYAFIRAVSVEDKARRSQQLGLLLQETATLWEQKGYIGLATFYRVMRTHIVSVLAAVEKHIGYACRFSSAEVIYQEQEEISVADHLQYAVDYSTYIADSEMQKSREPGLAIDALEVASWHLVTAEYLLDNEDISTRYMWLPVVEGVIALYEEMYNGRPSESLHNSADHLRNYQDNFVDIAKKLDGAIPAQEVRETIDETIDIATNGDPGEFIEWLYTHGSVILEHTISSCICLQASGDQQRAEEYSEMANELIQLFIQFGDHTAIGLKWKILDSYLDGIISDAVRILSLPAISSS